MKKTPVRGMRDQLPQAVRLRDFVLGVIEKNATKFGFAKIETPAQDHVENLTGKIGGENEKLIFRILKRGAEFERALSDITADAGHLPAMVAQDFLADSALRYDLTVPLARYFSAHQNDLPLPFKALQIGSVWRADSPQKGRFREFRQCDFDILGDTSGLAEIDCICVVASTLSEICARAGISGLTIHLNDRRLLTAACAFAGFAGSEVDTVLITLDKQDKIGLQGVHAELLRRDLPEEKINRFLQLFADVPNDVENPIKFFAESTNAPAAVATSLTDILHAVKAVFGADASIKFTFEPSLVRGMGYYTGPVFEVTADGLNSAIGGGGRYDGMIAKFTGQDVPACGFSIGFERLVEILTDRGFQPPAVGERIALLVSKRVAPEDYGAVAQKAEALRAGGASVSVLPMAHNLGKQIARLEAEGYTELKKYYAPRS